MHRLIAKKVAPKLPSFDRIFGFSRRSHRLLSPPFLFFRRFSHRTITGDAGFLCGG